MSRTKRALRAAASQRSTALQAWVATSGCWTTAALLAPHTASVVVSSTALALLVAYISARISRRPGRERWAHFPTFIGLLAATVTTNAAQFAGISIETALTGEIELKSWITAIFVGMFLIELLWPIAVYRFQKIIKRIQEEVGRSFERVLRDVLGGDGQPRHP